MPDASYDAVIIGAGHNGLCLGAYLARAGMKVGIFERRHDEGGGAHTDEATVPGFWHNLHAQYMEFIEMMPIYRDFDLPSFGARVIKPDAQVGITFADGRPPLIIYRPELADRDSCQYRPLLAPRRRYVRCDPRQGAGGQRLHLGDALQPARVRGAARGGPQRSYHGPAAAALA